MKRERPLAINRQKLLLSTTDGYLLEDETIEYEVHPGPESMHLTQ